MRSLYRKRTPLLLALAVILPVAAFASSIDLRCEGSIIAPGAHKYEVLSLCGQPNYVESREVYKSYRMSRFRDGKKTGSRKETRIEVPILFETWIYDLGPYKLLRYLHFRNDILVEISAGDKGYR